MALRILYAEDTEIFREVVAEALEGFGYAVTAVEDGERAFHRLIDGEKYDVILTDNRMPVLSGLQLLLAIRSDDDLKHLPVIMLSTDTKLKDSVEAKGGIFVDKQNLDLERLRSEIAKFEKAA